MTNSTPERARTVAWFMRVRALFAGALVLGFGATLTLASWNDSEFGQGSFTASAFDTESSTDGSGTWASHASSPGATLAFAASAMEPSKSFYSWINVRTTAATTVGGTIELADAATTGTLPSVVEYRAVRTSTSSSTCDATAFTAGADYIAGGNSSYIASNTVPGTPVTETLQAASGNTLRFCFDIRVTASSPSSTQGTTGTVTWHFAATSD